MERWQLIVIVVIASAAWYLYKRFVKKEPVWGEGYRAPQPEVENWYAVTMDAVDAMDETLRSEKEAEWAAKNDDEKLKYSESFLREKFGQKAVDGYNRKQRMQIGLAHFLVGDREKEDDQQEQDEE